MPQVLTRVERRIEVKALSYGTYYDRVLGGWFGKCLGGAAGTPIEGIKNCEETLTLQGIINTEQPNDDLDIQLLWLELLKEKGIYFTAADMAEKWDKQCWYPFSEYGYFLKNYERGILPPMSGSFNNSFFKEGMGSPIRSEIWGMIFPGDPQSAVRYAGIDSDLDHAENSKWAEQLFAAMESMAFFVADRQELLEVGLSYIPKSSYLFACVQQVKGDFLSGKSWRDTRQHILCRFSHPDFTNVLQNVGFVVLGLLYGGGDMEKSINLALNCGYDADCTCATLGAILGIMTGYERCAGHLKKLVNNQFVIGIDVKCRDNTLTSLATDTCAVGYSLMKNGGSSSMLSDMPPHAEIYHWERPQPNVRLGVTYGSRPAIGVNDTAEVTITATNETMETVRGRLCLTSGNRDILWNWYEQAVRLDPGETISLVNCAATRELASLPQTNRMHVGLYQGDGLVAETTFGLAGAWVFTVYGPYFSPMQSYDEPYYPPCHGGESVLPSVEAMVNNEVSLKEAYLQERCLLRNPEALEAEPLGFLNAYEDLLPLDEMIRMQGQACCYLVSSVCFEEETKAWLVIGHADAYQLYINGMPIISRDEIRLWTPYNSAVCTTFQKGWNRVVIKLLRRTESFRFSIGIRRFVENRHYHACRWHTDLTYGITCMGGT